MPHKKAPKTAVQTAQHLACSVGELAFRTPSHVYNPLQYAWPAQSEYLRRFATHKGRVILLGMNPGPWGMAQTGVPFGDVVMVHDWMGIEAPLAPPLPEQHEKYPIMGFVCHRREGSGSRLWGWARDRFGSAENFFERFFVWNYCPLLFLKDGRNLTPEKLRKEEAEPLVAACNTALKVLVEALEPAAVVGVGRYAQRRAEEEVGETVPVGYLPHPSPASPAANRGWAGLAEDALAPWLP